MPAWCLFEKPLALLEARRISEVMGVLQAAEREAARGRWAVGYVAYEAAPAFDRALCTHAPIGAPLAWFALFSDFTPCTLPDGNAPPLHLDPYLDEETFARRVAIIKDAIARGETYQVNFTFPMVGEDPAPMAARFTHMMRTQRCRYGAWIEAPAWSICSASPELFFERDGEEIRCKPMKGTARRGRWLEEDEQIREALSHSIKDRAENVMIVDMVRNDLGRIAKTGSVHVDRLFEMEPLPTVWQMTSTVRARSSAPLGDVFAALFPCASVTGAPKVQTMRIIREVETGPRGIYTGAIGFVGPGQRARFNVAIRTLVRPVGSRVRYDVGSGIVWDSEAKREYAECLAKSLFLAEDPTFDIFTSLRWDPATGPYLWDRHLERLARSCAYFGRPCSTEQLRADLANAARSFPPQAQRVRLSIGPDGDVRIEHASVPETAPRIIAIAREPVDSRSPFLFHKTSRREAYDRARAAQPDAEDVLLWNESGEITETTIANVAVRRAGRWITPPVACGLLAGVMREELLATGAWVEGTIRRDEIQPGEEIELANAVRGRWRARVVNPD